MISVKDERIRQNMSQKRLAFEAGMNVRTVRKIEKGEQVSPESLRSVFAVLGMTPGTLLSQETSLAPSTVHQPKARLLLALSTLGLFFLGTLLLAAYAPAFVYLAPSVGLLGVCVTLLLWAKSHDTGGWFAGGFLAIMGMVYWVAHTEGFSKHVSDVGLFILLVAVASGVPWVRKKLSLDASAPNCLHNWVMFTGFAWLASWLLARVTLMTEIPFMVRNVWGIDAGTSIYLSYLIMFPVVVLCGLVTASSPSFRPYGYSLIILGLSLGAGFRMYRLLDAAFETYFAQIVTTFQWDIASWVPSVGIVVICLYALARQARTPALAPA
jgi:transcriptional regulator with XRE-family HTH domain